jgi:hypothetical protein
VGDRAEQIITDAEVARVHGHANFGSQTSRQVLAEGVWKYSMGFTGGHTQLTILLEHGLIRKPKPGSYRSTLTKRGEAYLRATCPKLRLTALLRRAHDAMSRREPDGISAADWDALLADMGKELGVGNG